LVGDRLALAGDDLDDPVDRMLAVAGIHPLGRISEEEVAAALQPGDARDQRPAKVLGDAGIDGALVDDDRRVGGIDQAGDGLGRREQRPEIGAVGLVDRGRRGDDIDVGTARLHAEVGDLEPGAGEQLGLHLAGAVVAASELRHPGRIDVEADRVEMRREPHRERQADIAEADDGDPWVLRELHAAALKARRKVAVSAGRGARTKK
jgi:hypothetical protein